VINVAYCQKINEQKLIQRAKVWGIENLRIEKNGLIHFESSSRIKASNFIIDCYRQHSELKFDFYINRKRFRLIENDLQSWLTQQT
jgi:hypothetical protein